MGDCISQEEIDALLGIDDVFVFNYAFSRYIKVKIINVLDNNQILVIDEKGKYNVIDKKDIVSNEKSILLKELTVLEKERDKYEVIIKNLNSKIYELEKQI